MNRGGRWVLVAWTLIFSVCASARADTFADRFAAMGDKAFTRFPPPAEQAPPQPRVPEAVSASTPRAEPRLVPLRSTPPAQARQEELLTTAYAATPQNVIDNAFSNWLPRLLPTAVEQAPREATAALPPAPPPPLPVARPAPSLALLPPEATALPGAQATRFGLRIHGRVVPNELAALIAEKARKHRVPLDLAHAVVTVESNYNPKVTGRGATIGLMQIKHPTARSLGYTGTVSELYEPATNLEYGMQYLSAAHRLAKGDLCGTIMRYQGGLRAKSMSRDAVVYCSRVQKLLADANASQARIRSAANRF